MSPTAPASLSVYAPYDQQLLETLPLMPANAVEQALQKATACWQRRENWLPPHQRIRILEQLATLLQEHKTELIEQAVAEGGKPWVDSAAEVDRAINGVHVAIGQLAHMTGREIPMGLTPSTAHRRAYTYREPIGVVLSISAFNHPVNLTIHQVVPALAVGCPVLIKPAQKTPLSCRKVLDLLAQTDLPPDWCQLLLCDRSLTEKLVQDPRVNFMSFIGSSKVGWHLRSQLAPGTCCALEHGGVAPVIMEADADLDKAIPALLKGAFYHAGQVCVSTQRLFAHQAIANEVRERLREGAAKLVVGDPKDRATEVGPIITPENVQRIDSWVQEAIAGGATCLTGGKSLSETCYAPTVLLNPPSDAKVSTEEVFGPVLCLYTYADRKKAIAQANSLPYTFQAAAFTQNLQAALDCAQHLKATTVMINDHTAFRADWMPFGGREQAGLRMGGIIDSMHDMSCEKLVVLQDSQL